MDIAQFQEKLTELCKVGEKNNRTLTAAQIGECFSGMELDAGQMKKILQYLNVKGISIEGIPQEETEDKPEEVKIPLTAEEKAYLKEYMKEAEAAAQGDDTPSEELFRRLAENKAAARDALVRRYMPAAAQIAVELNCEELFIADLIQEAGMSLLMALEEEEPTQKDEQWLLGKVRSGVRSAAAEQSRRRTQDDSLVDRVEKLDAAMKELSDEDEEMKFSVDELAVILDMDVDEIRDVLRLTGE